MLPSIIGVFSGESLFYGEKALAGVIGAGISTALKSYLNPWGSLVVLLPLLGAGIMVGYDLPGLISSVGARLREIRQSRTLTPPKAKRTSSEPPKTARGKPPAPVEPEEKSEPRITIVQERKKEPKELPVQTTLGFIENYQLPPLSLLNDAEPQQRPITPKELKANASLILAKLKDFGVAGDILEIKPGPVITMYEFTPAPGIKINKIVALADDLAMALKAAPVRVVAPIPGKNAVGIEIPNRSRQTVGLRRIIASEEFIADTSPLLLALGTNIEGLPVVTDLAKMPHLLIAGATGTGKSVGLNTMILSLLFRCDPSELKFIMIDPKRIELSHYEGIPHLIHPVVIDPREALPVLKWAVYEMEMRYELFKNLGVKGLDTYNRKVKKADRNARPTLAAAQGEDGAPGILPRLVVVIDEMADLMMVNKEVEEYIARLAQMARAAGIYMIVATQRPSVDVVTGLIKANFPARISFRVSSRIDSRTILDSSGADQLLGLGDMLFLLPGTSALRRIHGAYVSEDELDRVVNFIRSQKEPEYITAIDEHISQMGQNDSRLALDGDGYDSKYDEALEFVTSKGSASISLIQRRFKIGYNRAARIIEKMEQEGIIGPSDTAGKPRKVLVQSYAQDMEE